MRWAALLCALAAPVAAQEEGKTYDPALLERCLLGKPAGGQAACIGVPTAACLYGPGLGSQQAQWGCINAERMQWDGRLNAAYQALMKVEKEEDAASSGPWPKTAPALQAMQRAWITWRDATCDYALALWAGGTGGGIAEEECLRDLTAQQAISLEQRLEDTQEGAYIPRPPAFWR